MQRERYIRASEVGDYIFCNRAWHLDRRDARRGNEGVRAGALSFRQYDRWKRSAISAEWEVRGCVTAAVALILVALPVNAKALMACVGPLLVPWIVLRHLTREKGRPSEVVCNKIDSERLKQSLVSHRYRLTGKPDYIIRGPAGAFPLELKLCQCGDTRPSPSEVAQVWAYCLLVEEASGRPVGFGLLQYADRKWAVSFGIQERREMLAILDEMRGYNDGRNVLRSHDLPARCRACGYQAACDQRLSA